MNTEWKHVRHIPPTLAGWDQEDDKITGDEVYGHCKNNLKAWAIKFDDLNFTKIKIQGSENKRNSKTYDSYRILDKKCSEILFLNDEDKIKSCGGADVYILE